MCRQMHRNKAIKDPERVDETTFLGGGTEKESTLMFILKRENYGKEVKAESERLCVICEGCITFSHI